MKLISTTQRLVCLSLATLVTLGLGQMLDTLAAREPGDAVMARAAASHARALHPGAERLRQGVDAVGQVRA